MFDPVLRPLKDRMLRPLALRMLWLRPGWITLASMTTGLLAAWAAWSGAFGLGAALWIACRTLDGLDGLVARERDMVSDLGGLLDLVADYVAYAAIPIAMALRPDAPAALMPAALVLLGTFYVNSAAWMIPAALLERRGSARGPTSVAIPEGLVSGGETVMFYTLFFLFPAAQVVLFGSMAALTAVTVVQRLVWALRTFGRPLDSTSRLHTGERTPASPSIHRFETAPPAAPEPSIDDPSERTA